MSIELKRMTPSRAAYFMERFKREEKLLGPNEQAALTYVIDMLEKATAIQQVEAQQPAMSEPVAWVVMNGVSKYQVCGARAPADALCSEMQKRHDLSGSLAAFHVLPLYTHPAPSVPDDDFDLICNAIDKADTSDLRIGVCITDGVLHAAVMQHESNGTITVVATAEIDAASLHGRDCIGRMKPAMLAAKDTK